MIKKKQIKIAVSGGFDPIHIGHIKMFKAAKALGDELIVIINNDNWLIKKKGFVFMRQKERKAIIEALACVDYAVISSHPKIPLDMSICQELKKHKPDIFANGGDRTYKNIPEIATCQKINCQMVFNVGGKKIQSSSKLAKRIK